MQRSYLSTRSSTWGLDTPTPRRVAQIASAIVLVIAVSVLIGWQLNLQVERILPGVATMKANTAVCFGWAGISLLLQTRKRQSDRTIKVASWCAIGVNVTALLTICQYVFGWNLGIDELLFGDSNSSATPDPGRMGLNTAVNFCLLGSALWLMNRPNSPVSKFPRSRVDRISIAQGLTIGTIAIALQTIVGYAYNVRVLYQLSGMTTSMALHTALCFALLGGGILVLTGNRGLMQVVSSHLLGSKVARRLLPTAIGLPLVLGWPILLGVRANWYDPSFALSLMAMSMATIWVGLIGQNAGKINKLDDDRLRSAEGMRSSEERLRLALLAAKQGIWEFDLQTQVLTWDNRCQELFGLLPAVVTRAGYLEAIHPEDRMRVVAATELAIDGGEFAQEYRTISSDGTIQHWVLAQGRCYGNAGTPERMLGTMMDITVRKQAQLNAEFIGQLTRRLRQMTDPDEMQWEAAQSLGEYLQVDRATWCKVDWPQRLMTVERDWYREGLASLVGVYGLGDLLSPELQVALFAGESVVIADLSAEPLIAPYLDTYQQWGMGAIVKVPCIFEERWVTTLNVSTQNARVWRDDEVTLMQAIVAQIWALIEQTRADRALKVAAEQTRADRAIIDRQLGEIEAIYRSAPVGLCFVDTDLKFVRINQQLADLDGVSVSGHLGRTIRDVLPEMADDIEPLYRQVLKSGEPIIGRELTGILNSAPGVIRHWVCNYHPQTDAEHRVVGVNVMVQEITDRKRRELQIQQAEVTIRQQLGEIEAIYLQAPVGLCFVDLDLRYVRINERLAQINGASVEAHIGNTLRELLPELADDIEPIYRQVMATGEPTIELEVNGTNPAQPGVSRAWLSSYYPQIDAEHRIVGVNTVVQEITERKREAAALQESERNFSAIFNQTFELIGLLDVNGVVLNVNQAALDSLVQPAPWQINTSAGDIIGTELWETPWWRYFPELQQQLRAAIERAKCGEFIRHEIEFPQQIGTSKPTIDFSIKPIFDERGIVTTLIVEGRDITALKQIEADLRSSQQKFSAIFEQTFELLGIISLEGVLLDINQAALDSIAAQKPQLVGKLFWETPWWHTAALRQQTKAAISTAAGGEFIRYEVEFPHPQGGTSILDFSFKPVFDKHDRVTTIVAEAHDITDRVRAQVALEQRTQELDRAAAILHDRNRELDSFVYVVSHDLKAPLRGISNLSQWIEDDLEDESPQIQQHTVLLRSRIQRMDAIIDGLLDYARSGRSDDRIEPVAVAALLAETIDSIAPPPTFKITIAPDLPTLQTKRLFLSQVLTNLIGNAIKHHHRLDGSIQISVRDCGDTYEFTITDDGPGIAPEHHDRVFEIFKTLNPQNRPDSTGIGLAIVKKIIEAEGGTIRLQSQLGAGTTFSFFWPKQPLN